MKEKVVIRVCPNCLKHVGAPYLAIHGCKKDGDKNPRKCREILLEGRVIFCGDFYHCMHRRLNPEHSKSVEDVCDECFDRMLSP